MTALLVTAAVALLSGGISLLTWLTVIILKHIKSDAHQSPKERDALAKVIEEQIRAHSELDMERFRIIEEKLKEVGADIKTLLGRPAPVRTRRKP